MYFWGWYVGYLTSTVAKENIASILQKQNKNHTLIPFGWPLFQIVFLSFIYFYPCKCERVTFIKKNVKWVIMDRKKVKDLRTKCHSFLVVSLPKCKDDLIVITLGWAVCPSIAIAVSLTTSSLSHYSFPGVWGRRLGHCSKHGAVMPDIRPSARPYHWLIRSELLLRNRAEEMCLRP